MGLSAATETQDNNYDRAKEVKQFDDSKLGIKGLLDSGITTIPRFFLHDPSTLPSPTTTSTAQIPVVDLLDSRSNIVNQVHEASRSWGFFQIINHGVPLELLDGVIGSIKGFNEMPTEFKARYYSREMGRGALFSTNFDLFRSKAACWRDTLEVKIYILPDLEWIPEICREEVVEWDRQMVILGETLMGILSEGLGLETERLKKMTCLESRVLAAHYYPYCPEPDRTVGVASHTDPGVLTVLLQDQVGGLQVKHGEEWVDIKPIHGALLINIGDILQMISNDEYKSVDRVLANRFQEPRISIAVFFNPSERETLYGPFPELVSPENPALYQQFTLSDFLRKFLSKELGKSSINMFKL
ncbi:hypothetical protein GIB67_020917 [Kingdonia uniflora]|uniref:Fe2OG dioxygenase domain-containing protein n=1 Tax=Kingdonia uniflora TaxID=39325 RepID=A0A7J7M7T3_9MAGN|nr:hypothetical protein GIB67_020917 [Kingdonia uniflora]